MKHACLGAEAGLGSSHSERSRLQVLFELGRNVVRGIRGHSFSFTRVF